MTSHIDISLKRISYKDLRDDKDVTYQDTYHIVSDYLTSEVKKTLLSNPNLSDYSKTVLNIVLADGIIVGRNMLMPTKIKANGKCFKVQSGGSYEIAEQFRGRGLGRMLFTDSIVNSENDMYIGQLYSTAASSIVKKISSTVFELPMFYKLCKSRPVLESRGVKGLLLKTCVFFADRMIWLSNIPNSFRIKKLKKEYRIKEESIIPTWVNDITLNDGHKFMEVHDREWLQWCLDNSFTNGPKDRQFFFTVHDKGGLPKGFFMTKVRFEKKQGTYKNITRGTIVEWGSNNEVDLSELDLCLLAVDTLSSYVDNITTVLSSKTMEKPIKRIGFFRHGSYQMSIANNSVKEEGITDQTIGGLDMGVVIQSLFDDVLLLTIHKQDENN